LNGQSNSLEQRFLALLEENGYRLPDDAQQVVDGYYVRPDFAYHTRGMDVAVFIDGPIHDSNHQHEKDEQAGMKLENEAGWMVLRFHHTDADAGWLQTMATNADVFGPGRFDA
jgi:very-short-patch-repair endonuclease